MVEVGEINTIVLTYKLNDTQFKQLNSSSNFIFLSRTVVNEDLQEHWPKQNGTERYHAYRFETFHHVNSLASFDEVGDAVYDNRVRIGTLDEILNKSNWKTITYGTTGTQDK